LTPTTIGSANNIYSFQLKIASGSVLNSGTAQAGASGTITLASGASSDDDTYNDQIVRITGGTGIGQSRRISDYTGSSRVAAVSSNWTTTPDDTSTYEVGWQDSDFSINDISIFYRLKPPGAGA